MNKLYSVHDHWTDIGKKNDVDIESIDGVITGIKVNGEDFGGISWTRVFTGDVVTSGKAAPFSCTIPAELSGADTIKVIYNNNVYILNKQTQGEIYYYGATIGEGPSDINFSVYPFVIAHINDSNVSLYTQSPGPQDLTIFELQSGGGSSDFSTAEVSINWNPSVIGDELSKDNCPMIWRDNSDENSPYIQGNLYVTTSPVVVEVPLYKGKCYWHVTHRGTTVTGNIEELNEGYLITGNCTITIS